MIADRDVMEQAIRAATRGLGRTGTNPLVGACLVKDNEILGTAAHLKFGGKHAEHRLLNEKVDCIEGSTLYLTLEPCIQPGKTPPCLPLIVEKGIKTVVLASVDPDPSVQGQGVQALRELGISVRESVGEREYRWLNRAYFHRQATDNPWVELKLALSADGYLATPHHHSQWITGERSRNEGHRLRSRVDAVMVGAGTLRKDDPRLTDRFTERSHQPKAVVVVRSSRGIRLNSTLLTDRAERTLMVVPPSFSDDLVNRMSDRGVTVLRADLYEGQFDWTQVLPRLSRQAIGRILVEGGSNLAGSLLDQSIVNELHLFYSGRLFGNGIPALKRKTSPRHVEEAPRGHLLTSRALEEDVYVRRLIPSNLSDEIPDASGYKSLFFDWLKEY